MLRKLLCFSVVLLFVCPARQAQTLPQSPKRNSAVPAYRPLSNSVAIKTSSIRSGTSGVSSSAHAMASVLPFSATSALPIIGGPDDGLPHLPTSPSWGTADSTAKCGTYTDTLGSALGGTNATVTRLTKAETDIVVGGLGSPMETFYSVYDTFNADDSFLMLLTNNSSYKSFVPWRRSDCNPLVTPGNMPGDMGHGSEPIWHATDPNSFYYTDTSNHLKLATITGLPNCGSTNSCTLTTSTVHTFSSGGSTGSGYTNIMFMDIAALSPDGNHLPIVGLNPGSGTYDLAVYHISTDTFTVEYTTSTSGCKQAPNTPIAAQPDADCLHKMEWSGPNNHLVFDTNSAPDLGTGIWITNGTSAVHALYSTGTAHHACTADPTNTKDWCFQVHTPTFPDPCNNNGGISYEDISTGSPGAILCSFANNFLSSHVAGSRSGYTAGYYEWDTAPNVAQGPPYYTADPNYRTPSFTCSDPTNCGYSSGGWGPWALELCVTSVNSVGRTSLGWGSSSGTTYCLVWTRTAELECLFCQAKGSISRDGRYIAWTSTFAHPNGAGITNAGSSGYYSGACANIDCSSSQPGLSGPTDVYLIGPLF